MRKIVLALIVFCCPLIFHAIYQAEYRALAWMGMSATSSDLSACVVAWVAVLIIVMVSIEWCFIKESR